MNNIIFGKTMENVRGRMKLKLYRKEHLALRAAAKPSFIDFQIFGEQTVALIFANTVTKLNKPIYIGLTVLDQSKVPVYKFHYEFISSKYGEKSKLLYTDTDSLTYNLICDDVYEDMKNNCEKFDFSNYEKDHALFNNDHKAVIGYWKDEMAGDIIHHFVGLAPKLYAFKYSQNGSKFKSAARGIPSATMRSSVNFETYEHALHLYTNDALNITKLQTSHHTIRTCNVEKFAFTCFDIKRYLLSDNIHTLPYGHYAIRNDENQVEKEKDDSRFLHVQTKRQKLVASLNPQQ